MTGFARDDGVAAGMRWHWELRSVNARGLDLRMRFPSGFERLEPLVRERAQGQLGRGALNINLSIQREDMGAGLRINEAALEAVLAASASLIARADVAPPSADGLLALKGVLETHDPDEDEAARADLDAGLLASFTTALDRLVAMRRAEGERLRSLLEERLSRIAALVDEAETSPARTPETIRRRLDEQIQVLVEAAPSLDSERLHQEAVLLATKVDIREELDRLRAHTAAARDLLDHDGPIGRRLDFLTQEFNREANTLCSKSNDIGLTRIGLELKAVVDQMREQVQNVE